MMIGTNPTNQTDKMIEKVQAMEEWFVLKLAT